jgi:hypothetical protein
MSRSNSAKTASIRARARQQLKRAAPSSDEDLVQIGKCRRPHKRLGSGYQVAFVRLFNRFQKQQPFEVMNELVTFSQEAQNPLAHLKSWLAKKDAPRETARPSDCRECCTETETFESSASIPCTTRTADA